MMKDARNDGDDALAVGGSLLLDDASFIASLNGDSKDCSRGTESIFALNPSKTYFEPSKRSSREQRADEAELVELEPSKDERIRHVVDASKLPDLVLDNIAYFVFYSQSTSLPAKDRLPGMATVCRSWSRAFLLQRNRRLYFKGDYSTRVRPVMEKVFRIDLSASNNQPSAIESNNNANSQEEDLDNDNDNAKRNLRILPFYEDPIAKTDSSLGPYSPKTQLNELPRMIVKTLDLAG